jgi:predicted amidophosphoribosyltransferase
MEAKVVCGACGQSNRVGRRFCGECGAALSAACPSCGAVDDEGAKFCGVCGSPLAPTPTRAALRPKSEPRDYTPKHLADKILQSD